tara:strand:- start:692 stop:1228 length:537 start_codon:yes stop_codon:yes gene_type:complete
VLSLNIYINKKYTKLTEVCRKLTSDKYPDYEDLLHEVILELYSKDEELINGLIHRGELLYYIVRIMINQYHSSTSPFYCKYKRHYKLRKQYKENYIFNKEGGIAIENWEELKEMERKLNWIDDKCKNLNWFDVQIFKIYYLNGFSLTTMQMATKINRNTLGKSVRIVKNYLKNEQEKT